MTTKAIATVLMTLSLGAFSAMASQSAAPAKRAMSHDHMMMAAEPHHVLAMAYHQNLLAFTKALQEQTARSSSVNVDFARAAVAEMRHSFDQMQQHHQAQKAMMADHMTPPMSETMQRMETQLTALGEHLTALESEVGAATPDPKKVSSHTSAVLKQCADMSAMHDTAKPHQMP